MSSVSYNHIKAYRVLAYAYFDNKCCLCGSIKNLRIHHKDGGSSNNELTNLILICSGCHGKQHTFSRFVDKEGIKLICKKCKYSWEYKRKNVVATCPSCLTKNEVK